MFGNKNRIIQEEISEMKEKLVRNEKYFQKAGEKKDVIEADYHEISESRKIVSTSLDQIHNNAGKITEFSQDSLREIAQLGESIEEIGKQAADNIDNLHNASEAVAKQYEATCSLVEDNKHFTSPSKYLTEVPGRFKEHNRNYMMLAQKMTEYSKQMSVLALNAAIEAGRLGDNGKLFVNAAEDVRVASNEYIDVIEQLKKEVEVSNAQIDELQEQVSKLVSLLKENNVATTKLMKQGMNLNKEFSKCDVISPEMFEGYKQQLITLKNAQEEIGKYEERNRLTIDDIRSEIETQNDSSAEIKDALESIYNYID